MILVRPGSVARWGVVVSLFVAFWASSCGREGITVFGAASLSNALEEAALAFEKDTGTPVLVRTEGSGLLTLEILNGAPADVFIPAAEDYLFPLARRGLVDSTAYQLVAWNRLVLVVPNSALASVPRGFANLNILERIAMGDPESVPAGRYTAQGLASVGLWPTIQDRMVFTHSVRAALALVERREVQGGFVYASDVQASDKVKLALTFPEQSHDPVVYLGAVLKDSPYPEKANRFLEFLTSAEGKRILRSHGLGGS